jgi:peptidoglycan/LPS O-acetylase OafA/YrhL
MDTAIAIPATPARVRVRDSLSFADYQRTSYFPALDGLRALAILMVLFHHIPGRLSDDPWYALYQNGRYGVSLFFIVSGYLICTLFIREEQQKGKISLKSFYVRRTIRLFPLYYVILAVQTGAVYCTHLYQPRSVVLFTDKLPSYIFYYSNFLPTATDGPFFFAWSLAVEEQFYLWFGFALVFLSRRALLTLVTAALFIKLIAYNVFGPLDAQAQVYRVIFGYREQLLAGVLLAFGLSQRNLYEKIAPLLARPGVGFALATGCIGFLALHPMTSATDWDGVLLTAAMTLITSAVVTRSRVPFLSNAAVAHYGKVSYGIYLMHMFVIPITERLIPASHLGLRFVAAAIVTGVCAVLSFAFFENPLIQYFRQRRARRESTDSAVPIVPAVVVSAARS